MSTEKILPHAFLLYETDGGFKCFMDQWVSDKFIPFGLGDYLEENLQHIPFAAAVRWGLEQRRILRGPEGDGEEVEGRIYPCVESKSSPISGASYWISSACGYSNGADTIPVDVWREIPVFKSRVSRGMRSYPHHFYTPTEAIIGFLDAWARARPSNVLINYDNRSTST